MDKVIDVFITNIDKFWTVIMIILGAYISYFSTSSIERHKVKLKLQKEKLEEILIPYCTTLENTKKIVGQLIDINTKNNETLEYYKDLLEEPLKYLSISSKIFLPKECAKYLDQYGKSIETLFETYNNDFKKCHDEYKKYLESELEKCEHVVEWDSIICNFSNKGKVNIKSALVNKSKISLLDKTNKLSEIIISNNIVISEYDWSEQVFSFPICNYDIAEENETSIHICYKDSNGYTCFIEDYCKADTEKKLEVDEVYNLLNFFNRNQTTYDKKLNEIIECTKTKSKLLNICNLIEIMRKSVTKDIIKLIN